jgi:LPPG:FO 2-phospho-L-lactate transferase
MKVVALAGGTGSAKLLRGLYRLPISLTVVSNVGDDYWVYGVYVCPDVDIGCYTLAGLADTKKGWGIAGDTFNTLDSLARFGVETWFRLGDRDFATCLARTQMLKRGWTLTRATNSIRRSLGVKCLILPASDEPVETRILTPRGDLHLQEFWVREKGRPRAKGVRYKVAGRAGPTQEVADAIESADRVVVCPANPVTSIGPMLALRGFRGLLERAGGRVVALSPMAGRTPFSGPAGKLMKACHFRNDSVGVARLYSKFLDSIVISKGDSALRGHVSSMGIECKLSDTMMGGPDDELRLAKELIEA